MTEPFHALYWDTGDPEDPELLQLFHELGSADTATRAVHRLLNRDDPCARGVALEYSHAAAAAGRFGEGNVLDPLTDAVAAAARAMLGAPPVELGQEGALIRG